MCFGARALVSDGLLGDNRRDGSWGHASVGAWVGGGDEGALADGQSNDRIRDRFNGAVEAMTDAGVEVRPEWVVRCPYDIGLAKEHAQRLLTGRTRPSAIIGGNDIIAQATLYAARSLGYEVPDSLSVIGIGDFISSAHVEPPLTTVRIPANQIGKRAADSIVRMVTQPDGGDGAADRHILIEPSMKIRRSTSPYRPPEK